MFNPEKQILEGGFEGEAMNEAKRSLDAGVERIFASKEEEDINKKNQNL